MPTGDADISDLSVDEPGDEDDFWLEVHFYGEDWEGYTHRHEWESYITIVHTGEGDPPDPTVSIEADLEVSSEGVVDA